MSAVALHVKPKIYPKVEDDSTIVLTYPKSQTILQGSWNWPFDRKDMEVYGATGYVDLALAPGNYAAICLVSDPTTHQQHIMLGMSKAFTNPDARASTNRTGRVR